MSGSREACKSVMKHLERGVESSCGYDSSHCGPKGRKGRSVKADKCEVFHGVPSHGGWKPQGKPRGESGSLSNRAGETVVPKTEKLNLETGKTERIYSRGESQGMIRTKFQRKLDELPFSLFILFFNYLG